MPLTSDERTMIVRLQAKLGQLSTADRLNDSYYDGAQRLEHLGLAVPPELRRFTTIVNWPRLVVDAIEERCDVKSFIRGGDDVADAELREAWDVNNMDSEFSLAAIDSLVIGRGFISVGTNEDDREHPIIAVESPHEMVVDIDPRTRRVLRALKVYGADYDGAAPNTAASGMPAPKFATLMLPNETIWCELSGIPGAAWSEVDRDRHNLGRVPVVPLFNRRRSGRWFGVSEIEDAKTLTDAAARSLTNLQIAGETHSVPQKWVLGMSKGDFVDASGDPIPAWESYFSAIWANQNKDAKVGQFMASDLRNFHETITLYSGLIAGMYGLPVRYFGQNTANPPSADGIRADEARLIKRAERKMSSWGDQIGRVAAMYLRFRDGAWPESGDRIKVEWHDAATPTYAAKVDGIQKLTGGKPILSQEGGWDELGWTDARKMRERSYLEAEASDPALERLTRELMDAAQGQP